MTNDRVYKAQQESLLPVGILSLLLIFFPLPMQVAPLEDVSRNIERPGLAIEYGSRLDIQRLCRRLDTGYIYSDIGARPEAKSLTAEDELAYKVELILRRVEELLDMHPEDIYMKIVIYDNKQSLDEKYFQLYSSKNPYEAFYAKDDQAIYVNGNSVTTRILAHEIAHFIMEQYFVVSPPDKIQEILASYIDSHLTD